ncbi:MAG: ATP-binding protein [Desulfobacteraceae bacterium]|jgi:PAS domain S-box-containing protein
MNPEKILSKYLTLFLAGYVSLLLIPILCMLYLMMARSINTEFCHQLQTQQAELGMLLQDRFDNLEAKLMEMGVNDKLKNCLVKNNMNELSSVISSNYSYDNGAFMTVFAKENKSFVPELPEAYKKVRKHLIEINRKKGQGDDIPAGISDSSLSRMIYTPVADKDVHYGTAFLLYNINQDARLWQRLKSHHFSTLFGIKDGGLVDQQTGESALENSGGQIVASGDPDIVLRRGESLVPVKKFPQYYFEVSSVPFNTKKKNFIINLAVFGISFLIFTILVSLYISRKVTTPFYRRIKEAILISEKPKDSFLNEDRIEYSEHKKIEESVIQSKETLQVILSSMPFGVVIVGEDKKIITINNAALKIMGYNNEAEILGLRCHDIMCPAEEGHCPILDRNENIDRSERFVISRDGRKIPVLKSVIPIVIEKKRVLLETFFDITDRKKAEKEKKELEQQLQRAMKMEAIGTLAGGVAHDLNNILAGLVSYPELLLLDIPEDSHLRKPILTIQKSGEKAAAIVQDLLTLARRGVSTMETVNLNKIIEEYLKSPEHQRIILYNPDVKVHVSLEAEILNIMGSIVHLSKTVMNLVSNAAEAMPEGGKISISTCNMYIDESLKGYDRVNEGDYVVLKVSDTGIGMSEEDKERIFEPFYTKKKMGKSGTGLGMAVVWGTIKDHNGYIDIESREDRGTTFQLYLPVTRVLPEAAELNNSKDKYLGKGEKILVIDDMEEQRVIAECLLSKLNYKVASVSSGESAVEYIRDNPVDLLVLDMIMTPGIDGLETYRQILNVCPGQKAIIASGYSEGKRVKEAQRLGAGEYIRKPYLMERIGRAVRNELDRLKN